MPNLHEKPLRTLSDVVGSLCARGDAQAILRLHGKAVETWSSADILKRTDEMARRLVHAGPGKGGSVILSASNSPAWIVACLAVVRAGLVLVPIDTQLDGETLDHIIEDSGARIILTDMQNVERFERFANDTLVLIEDSDAWRALPDEGAQMPDIMPADPAVLFYTSGTTGMPKGVPLSHANLVFQIEALIAARIVHPGDRLLLPLPLHHAYPFVFGLLAPLTLGVPIVMPGALTGPRIAKAVRGSMVTVIIGVPRLFAAFEDNLLRQVEARGCLTAALFRIAIAASLWLRRRANIPAGTILRPVGRRISPALRLLVSGGAALDPEVGLRLEALGWQVATGYGLTETSPMLTWNLPGEGKLDSAGKPIPGIDLRIVPLGETAPTAGEAAERAFGEIQARGPGVFSGYRNLPAKTAEAFAGDGWYRTGDLGYLDSDGYLHISGRRSTMIVTEAGKHVDPEALEEVYLANSALREVAILQKNRRLVALIVPSPMAGRGAAAKAAVDTALRARRNELPSYQQISDYALTSDPLPRTRLGKLRRHLLEERFDHAKQREAQGLEPEAGPLTPEKMAPEDRQLLRNPAADAVWTWLAARYADRRLTPNSSPQLDLGVDSIEWLNISLEIGRRTGVELSEEAIAGIETVRDLLREVNEAAAAGERFESSILDDPDAHLTPEQQRWLAPLKPWQAGLASVLYLANRSILRLACRLDVEGREGVPEGQVLFAPTHGSLLDPFAVGAALDHARLARSFWAGDINWAFGNPLSRAFSRLARVVPIDVQHGFISAMAFGAAVLKRGESLIWFPEGQRARRPELQGFMPGIGLLLAHFAVPVVPVIIHGAHEVLPPGRLLPRPGRIRVILCEPLDPAVLEREGTGDQRADRITDGLHRRMALLYREAYPASSGETPPRSSARSRRVALPD